MNHKLIQITKLLLDFMFYLGIFVTMSLYFIIKYYGKYFHIYFGENLINLTILFTVAGIFAVLIIYELRKIFRSVIADDCFIQENVKSLSKMATYSFIIASITTIRLVIYMTPAVIVVFLVFLIAGLFSKVLSQVFDKAVTYKLENDLTI